MNTVHSALVEMRLLIPRLERFHADQPDVEVVITTATTLHDGGFDVAVRRGSGEPGAWPHCAATPFLSETDTLVASPALLERWRCGRLPTSRTTCCSPASVGPLPVLEADVASGRFLAPFPGIAVRRTGYMTLVSLDAGKSSVSPASLDGSWRKAGASRPRLLIGSEHDIYNLLAGVHPSATFVESACGNLTVVCQP